MKEVRVINKNSQLVSRTIGILYPFIILFGFYLILNGHITPGGGFQGGAVLSSAFISRYLVNPVHDVNLHKLQIIEKLLYILVVLIPTVFLLMLLNLKYPAFNEIYLITINVIIGIKVCCGLSIIFFRFIFYESE